MQIGKAMHAGSVQTGIHVLASFSEKFTKTLSEFLAVEFGAGWGQGVEAFEVVGERLHQVLKVVPRGKWSLTEDGQGDALHDAAGLGSPPLNNPRVGSRLAG